MVFLLCELFDNLEDIYSEKALIIQRHTCGISLQFHSLDNVKIRAMIEVFTTLLTLKVFSPVWTS